ncbi:hypothetical protein M0812_07500 [Anaeramoeba flamelloides]|uniref:Uncharacterized protein n=1 Tax=Anaeramoeba flamelloides TaxID=1746091 RepID=A0AAV8A3E6_9EUKA|nr:hypothetical protein M0812_07500 [Anaeramoeba flamelloides]
MNSNNGLIISQKRKNKNETKNKNKRLIVKETDPKKSNSAIDKIIDKIVEKKKLEKDNIILNNLLKNHSDRFLCYYHTQTRYIIGLFIRYQKHCKFISCSNFRFNNQSQDHKGSVFINHFTKITNNNNIQYTCDHLNRKHFTLPLEGEIYTINRNIKHNTSSIETVANDLYNILNNNSNKTKSFLSILVDYNETETNPRSFLALIYFGRLWRKLKLDLLNVCCYSSEQDYLNPSNGFNQYNVGGGGDDSDYDEGNEIKNLYFQKSNNDLKEISNWINSQKYQKFSISSTYVKCKTMGHPFNDLDLIRFFLKFDQNLTTRHQLLKDFMNEKHFLYNHAQRRPNVLYFVKCQNLECEHCSKFPMKNNDFIKFLKSNNFQIPFPIQSKNFPNHYCSLVNVLLELNFNSSTRSSNSSLICPLIPESIQKKLFEENKIVSSIINKNSLSLNKDYIHNVKRKRLYNNEENNI